MLVCYVLLLCISNMSLITSVVMVSPHCPTLPLPHLHTSCYSSLELREVALFGVLHVCASEFSVTLGLGRNTRHWYASVHVCVFILVE